MGIVPAAGILILTTLTASPGCAAISVPKRMVRLTVSWMPTNIPHDPYAELPKTLTRAGSRYCRMDLAKHIERRTQQLVIFNEPDMWDIDRVKLVAKHFVDPGPTYDCHLPIFGVDTKTGEEVQNLEFGRELEFFRTHRAVLVSPGDHSTGPRYKLILDDRTLTLTESLDGKSPAAIELSYGDRLQRINYLEWNDHLAFDPAVFSAPHGLRIEQGRIDWTGWDFIEAVVARIAPRLMGRLGTWKEIR